MGIRTSVLGIIKKASPGFYIFKNIVYTHREFMSHTLYAKADVSAEKAKTCTHARISNADDDKVGTRCTESAARKRQKKINGLTMLARSNRLTEKRDFQRVFSRGLSASTSLYAVRWARNIVGIPRFGFVVANKISKQATKRNTIRRRLREIIRKNLDLLPLPIDVVFIARATIVGARSRDIEPQVRRTLEIIKTRLMKQS